MAARIPVVIGSDGLPQQLQSVDSIGAAIGYAQSLAANGYQKLPSGLIMQWGTSAAPNNGTVTITFPIAFPTACVLLLSTPFANGVSNGIAIASFTMTMTTTGGTVGVRTQTGLTTGASTVPVQWQALGY